MSKLTKALTAAAGNAGGDNLYVEDVFSTYLYDGTATTQVITNGLDLAGEGGMVWFKNRTATDNNCVYDTERGAGKVIFTDTTGTQLTNTGSKVDFNADGFDTGESYGGSENGTGKSIASWSFRKAEKFFDVVTYAGNSTARTIAHNLGSKPAVIIIKAVDKVDNWMVYHDALVNPQLKYLILQSTNAEATAASSIWNTTQPTDSVFSLGSDSALNGVGYNYVAYLFASDAGGFGDDGDENIIKCGSFTTDSNAKFFANTGFEPQWVLVKRSDGTSAWNLLDTMRGLLSEGTAGGKYLRPNTSGAEGNLSSTDSEYINATGFGGNGGGVTGSANATFIYIAIRRPMKTPEAGTEVFTPIAKNSTTPTTDWAVGFPADMFLQGIRTYVGVGQRINTRLTGGSDYLETWRTDSTFNGFGGGWDEQDSYSNATGIATPLIGWFFKRATGFFDVVAYTGDKVLGKTVNHSLGVAPELIIIKRRTGQADQWSVGHTDLGWLTRISLNNSNAAQSSNNLYWNSTAPTSTQFTIGSLGSMNETGESFITYLFATLAGVSKVGSYTGTGSNIDVDCGFSAGARFILIKRTDSTGDWYVWDSVRGITAGNDPYLLLNTTAAEVTNTDYIDPLASGFTVTSSAPAALNASGGNYIFLAIA